jgi:hypothetical protein
VAEVLSSRAGDRARDEAPIRTLEERKEQLSLTLDTKVAQGNQIESQNGTSAVVLRPGRRGWFGLVSGLVVKSVVSVDERGHVTSRKIEA